MIMMQPGKQSILPLENRQWITCQFNTWVTYPVALRQIYAHSESIHCDVSDNNLYITSNYITPTNCYPHGFRNNSNSTDNIYGEIIIIGVV